MITKQMLVAIDELLSSKEEVNVTGLVNDITLYDDERVENSILVKLLLNNKLTLDTATRYSYTYGGGFIQYDYVNHSYIKDKVVIKETRYEYDEALDKHVVKNTYNSTIGIEHWENTSTNYDEVLAKARELYIDKHSKK